MFAVLRPPRHQMFFDDAESLLASPRCSTLALRSLRGDLGPFEPLDYASLPTAMSNGCLGSMSLTREGDKYVATCAMPGVKRDDISLEIQGNRMLTIKVQSGSKASSMHHPPGAATSNGDTNDQRANTADQTQDKELESAEGGKSSQHSFVVMERSAALPQLVDPSAITSTYTDGLLRVEIPIQPPALDDGPLARIAELEQQAKDADARIAELCKELSELKATARDAHQAVRRERAEAQRALQASRHVPTIENGS